MYIFFFGVFPIAGNNVKKMKNKMVQVGLHHCIAIVLQAKALYCNFSEAGEVYCKRSLVADVLYCIVI